MNVRATTTLLVASAAATLLAGCGQSATSGAGASDSGKPGVVTTTDVYGSIASAVAGDKATVHTIISDPAADPHEY